MQQLNPDIKIIACNERLTVANALGILADYDIVIDGTDNFTSRYLVNDAAVLMDKPVVYGAVSRFEGQVAVFNFKQDGVATANYRDLFPQPPVAGEILNCAETGVLGVLPGIIGTLMANETIKLITGIGTTLTNRLLSYNALANRFEELEINTHEKSALFSPAGTEDFQKMNYEALCASPSAAGFEISIERFDDLRYQNDIEIIDVREPGETPAVHEFAHVQVPLVRLLEQAPVIHTGTVVLFCRSGNRSMQAARRLFDTFGTSKKIYSLQGGIVAWKKAHTS